MATKGRPLKNKSTAKLLQLHAAILDELRHREVIRTSNSPTGDYAETLFRKAYGWSLQGNSSSACDAISTDGKKYQIKCRRITAHNKSRQLSAIRNLETKGFDFLACVLLNADYSVQKAIIVPRSKLSKLRGRYSKHVNGWLYHLDDGAWALNGAVDATKKIQAAERQI